MSQTNKETPQPDETNASSKRALLVNEWTMLPESPINEIILDDPLTKEEELAMLEELKAQAAQSLTISMNELTTHLTEKGIVLDEEIGAKIDSLIADLAADAAKKQVDAFELGYRENTRLAAIMHTAVAELALINFVVCRINFAPFQTLNSFSQVISNFVSMGQNSELLFKDGVETTSNDERTKNTLLLLLDFSQILTAEKLGELLAHIPTSDEHGYEDALGFELQMQLEQIRVVLATLPDIFQIAAVGVIIDGSDSKKRLAEKILDLITKMETKTRRLDYEEARELAAIKKGHAPNSSTVALQKSDLLHEITENVDALGDKKFIAHSGEAAIHIFNHSKQRNKFMPELPNSFGDAKVDAQ